MRVPRESMLILGLLTTVCLLGGVMIGVLTGLPGLVIPGPANTPTVNLPLATSTLTPAAQISVLLLGVNSLAAPQPVLEACWVLTFQPGIPQYYLVGFSPLTLVKLPGHPGEQKLMDIYAADRQIAVGSSLFTRDAVKAVSPGLLRPQAEVVFDRQMLAETVDMLGGITLYDEPLDGQTLLARYDAVPPEDPNERLVFQHDTLVAMMDQVKQQSWSMETVRSYFSLGQQWNPSLDWFLARAEPEMPLTEAGFFITYAPLTAESTPTP